MERKFSSSSAKDFIRERLDREIIRAFKGEHYGDTRLAYLGLPGESLLDILAWRDYIGRWTAVQIAETAQDLAVAERLETNVLKNHLETGLTFVRADIDWLLSTTEGRQRLHWPYQVVNLDYYGGLVYAAGDGSSRRIEALRGLFACQARTAFVLFLTLNLRDRDGGELERLVAAEEEDLGAADLTGVAECFRSHRELGRVGLLKLYVPRLLGRIADRHSLAFTPPILYRGTRPMVHFALRCMPFDEFAAGRAFGLRDRLALTNLPLHVLHDEENLRSVELSSIGFPS